MENIQKPDEQAPTAGEEQGVKEAEVKTEESQAAPLDDKAVLELLEESDKTMAKVEKWGVKLKQQLKKRDGDVDSDVNVTIEELQEKVAQLEEQGVVSKDMELQDIAKMRTKNAELRASLIAKNTASNTSLGTNQDKEEPEEDPLKGLNADQIKLYTRAANRHNLGLREYLKTIKK